MRIDNIMLAALALLLLSITVGGALAAQLPDQNSPRNITFTDNSGVKNASIVQFSDGTSATSWSSFITSVQFAAYQILVHGNFSALGTRVDTVNATVVAHTTSLTSINSTATSALTGVGTVNTTATGAVTVNAAQYINISNLQTSNSSLTTGLASVNTTAVAAAAAVNAVRLNVTDLQTSNTSTNTRINTVNTTAVNLQTSNTSLYALVLQLGQNDTNLNASVNAVNTRVTTLNTTIGGLYTNVTALQAAGGQYQNVTDLQRSNTTTNARVSTTNRDLSLANRLLAPTMDASPNNLHLNTISGNPVYYNNTYAFGGAASGDNMATTAAIMLQPYAISYSVWVNPNLTTAFARERPIEYGTYSNNTFNRQFYLNREASSTTWAASFTNSNGTTSAGSCPTSSFSLTPGVWNNVVATYNGTNVLVYVNGVFATNKTGCANNELNLNPSSIRLGSTGGFFNGSIQDVRVWNKTLSLSEITDVWNNNTVNDALVVWFPFVNTTAYNQYLNITALQAYRDANYVNVTALQTAGGQYQNVTDLQTSNTSTNTRVTTINSSLVGNQTVLYANITSLQSSNNTTNYRIDGANRKAWVAAGAWNATSDVTGNGNTLTQYGSSAYDSVNEWMMFGGETDVAHVFNLSAPITGFTSTGSTVAFWYNPNASTHRSRPISANLFATIFHDSGSTSYTWYCGNGTSYSAGTSISSAVSISAWQHLAITNDGTTCSLWKNGAVISTQASVGVGNMSVANPTFNIGAGGSADVVNGSIDDVRVYNRTLSLTDMQQLAANGSVMADLKGWWPFTTTVSFGQYQNITALQAAGGSTNYQNVTDLQTSNTSTNTRVTTINSTVTSQQTSITSVNATAVSALTGVGTVNSSLSALSTFAQTKAATGSIACANGTFPQNITLSNTTLSAQCAPDFNTGTGGGGSGGGSMDFFTVSNSSGTSNSVNITNGSTMRYYSGNGIYINRTTDDFTFNVDATVLTNTSLSTGLINTTLLNASNSPVTGYVPSYNGTGDQFTWIPAGSGGGGTIDGSGRAGAYAQWTDTDSLNSSGIFQNGSVFLVGNATSDNGAVYYQTMEVSGSGKRTYLTINDNTGEGASLHLRSLTEDFDILNNGTHLRFQYENRSFVNMSGITGEIRFNNTLYVNDGTVLTNTTVSTGLINSSLLDSIDSPAAGEVLSYVSAGQFEWVPDATGGGGSVTGLTSNGTKFGFNTGAVPNATLEIRPDGPLTTIENQSMYALMLKRVADNNGGAIGLGFVDSSSTTGQQVGASWIYTREGSNGYGNLSAYTKASGGALTYRMGLASNGSVLIPGLVSCDTINTDASGMLYCGSDATGGGGFTYSDYFDQTLNRSSVINASRFSAALGSIASPAITTNLNNDSGIFFLSDGTTGFSNDGAKTFQCNADGCQVPSGSAVFPGLQSTGDDDTGIFYKAGNVLGITAGGNVGGGEVANFSDQGVGVTALCLYPDSNPMMPCRGFHSDPEAARRYMTTDIDTFVVGGAETGEYGTWGWTTNTLPTGGDVTSTATTFDVKSMGVLSLGSGTVTGSNVSISTDTSTSAGFWINGSSGINAFYTRVAADLTGHTANNYTTMVGFTDVQDKRIGVDAVIAMYNSSESVNWILATCNTNVCSKNTSSVRWGNSSFADIEVQVWNNTQALMFINGTLAATLHSNLPSGSGDLMWVGSIRHGNTNGTTESRLYIDYYGVAKVFNEVRY